jgi:hypothetical protein
MATWKDLTPAQREYVKQLRSDGWDLYDAIIHAACVE